MHFCGIENAAAKSFLSFFIIFLFLIHAVSFFFFIAL